MLQIRKYNKATDELNVMQLISNEEGWDYNSNEYYERYKVALEESITYVAYQGNSIYGYSRSIDDCSIYIYVCDLLVSPQYRGNCIGKQLMECIYKDYPNRVVYVMSDVDDYYSKIGYERVGSIYKVLDKI